MTIFPDWNSVNSVNRAQNWCFWLGIFFFFLVLVFEIAAHVYGKRKDSLSESISEIKFDEAQKHHQAETEALRLRAENLGNELKATTQSTAKLEYRQMQRTLSPEIRKAMVETFSKFAPQRFQVLFPNGDKEALAFADTISHGLLNCAWVRNETDISYPSLPTEKNISTDLIVLKNPKDESSNEALTAIGRIMHPGMLMGHDDVPAGTIVIVVMTKPQTLESFNARRQRDMQWMSLLVPDFNEPNFFETQFDREMAKFAPQRFSLWSPFNDDAADGLAFMLQAGLDVAGWEMTSAQPTHADYLTNFQNVKIGVSDADDKANTVPAAAFALLDALKKRHIVGEADTLRIFGGMPKGEIGIQIGLSPKLIAANPATNP